MVKLNFQILRAYLREYRVEEYNKLEKFIMQKTRYFVEGQIGSLGALVEAAQVMLDKQYD